MENKELHFLTKISEVLVKEVDTAELALDTAVSKELVELTVTVALGAKIIPWNPPDITIFVVSAPD